MPSAWPLRAAIACGIVSISQLTVAQPVQPIKAIQQSAPTVIYDSGKTVDATRYTARRLRSREIPGNAIALPPAPDTPARSLKLADNLPLQSDQLKPGQLEIREVDGLPVPFFVLGTDPWSLRWFDEAADTLAAMNTIGFVVQATHRKDWLTLKALAQEHGIHVSLLNGNGLAHMYGFTTYPTVLVGTQGAQ